MPLCAERHGATGRSRSWSTRQKKPKGVLDVSDDLRPGRPEMRMRLLQGATSLGLSSRDIAQQLRAAFFGITAGEIQVGPEAYEIDVRLDAADRDTWADLAYFHITLPNGRQVPLGAVATTEFTRAWARIARVDGQRTVSVQGDVDPHRANTVEILGAFRTEFLPRLREEHPGVHASFVGECS